MTTTMEVTIPAYLCELKPMEQEALDALLCRFGSARHRAYRLRQKGGVRANIETILQQDHGLNGRYAKDAYYSIQALPRSHVTFGGLHNQRLREKGKITKAEYRARRNAIVLARGEKTKQGNLNLRVCLRTMRLRISTGRAREWVSPKLFIPKKYLQKYGAFLDGTQAYMVLIRRRDVGQGYDVRITVPVPVEKQEGSRLLALDVNAGHTDFAILNKADGRVLVVGKVNHHETQYVRQQRRTRVLHDVIAKVGNLARHYQADVVVGTLNTGHFKSWNKKATRKIRQMPQYKFRQLLKSQLGRQGLRVLERSERNTSKVGAQLAPFIGFDVHKCAAILFALKVIDYSLFRALMTSFAQVVTNEGSGSLRKRQQQGRELTAPRQSGRVKFWRAMKRLFTTNRGGNSTIPGSRGLSFLESLQSIIAYRISI